ncbi:endopeptidase [Erwinia sp. OLTSP20]|uniref:C40 family peptidase n=1 Tax=unclassified Erwinia TaxID=2622719 RepID=UPI000C174A61|nr:MULTISPECIES: C40 family peptidase [unclassified Erwinia]PIJ51662.1 endopeptidase [Erwinia sp. OAMSP11]PIJ75549.1 endopeptidase [Erwinia sp. OLSSP12]PIJ84853.1 endopeptidase [Erwinia sp. OLCASP19]PIJ86632.1 endopeptidase [Erwinia sp. OLMTSP26]PIJ88073.1 endopeptidase [Erwinia sp. OLMDSP33]
MRLLITLIILAFAQLFLNMAHASPRPAINLVQQKAEKSPSREDERRKRRATKTPVTKKVKQSPQKKSRLTSIRNIRLKKRPVAAKKETHKLSHTAPAARTKTTLKSASHHQVIPATAESAVTPHHNRRTATRKHYGRSSRTEPHLVTTDNGKPLQLSKTHLAEFSKARAAAMEKLMNQLGKPYLWGGASPRTGFDCSGLVWYAFKDLVNYKLPRTANEMFHLRDAAPVRRNQLQRGDLVFFHIRGHKAADHVGVYLGNGKFIQSPRTGEEIHVSTLADSYWQRHYLGARRMMTPGTIR